MGVLYVLDEPSIGLHQRDNDRLIATLKGMRDLGNTVLVVEHDEDTILAADWVLDLGPGAGIHGGELVACGTPEQVAEAPDSLTGKYLRGELSVAVPKRRRAGNGKRLVDRRRAAQQPPRPRRRLPARRLHGGDRRLRLGQEQPGERHPASRPGAALLRGARSPPASTTA